MKKQFMFERECIHREDGTEGEIYNGMFFVQALQRLQSAEAVKMAGKVSPFFWVDAPRVVVWLCRDSSHKLWSDAIVETLRRRELIDKTGQPHSITRNYILSGVTGDGFDMRLVDPRA